MGRIRLIFIGLSVLNGTGLENMQVQKQEFNPTAVAMFALFILSTFCITYYSSKKAKVPADFAPPGGASRGCKTAQPLRAIS